jgi:polysaccharide biosynthesis/export protein
MQLLCLATPVAMTGCGSLPSSGPSISMIESGAESKSQPGKYVLVTVDQQTMDVLEWQRGVQAAGKGSTSLNSSVADLGKGSISSHGMGQLSTAPIQKISAGDMVEVSIYTSGGGLFGNGQSATDGTQNPTENSETSLPPQLVDSTGEITVPHAGRIPVVGHTPHEVEGEITDALKGQAIMPSVIVTIQERRGSDLMTVAGDVRYPTRIAIPMSGLRVIDAITAAGGSTGRDYETTITILRGQNITTDNYADIVAIPSKNIFLQVGDTILVKTEPWTFTSVGAMGQSLHPFPRKELTAEEAIASVNGLNDDKANPEAVFIYRFESPELLKALGVAQVPATAFGVPVIYQLNLREPDGIFMARQFALRDKDVIFVGNAGSIGIIKALNIVGAITSPAISGLSATAGAAEAIH